MPHLEAIKIGKVQTYHTTKSWESGIAKNPVGLAQVTSKGIFGDFQADLKNHGGLHKAILCVSLESLTTISSQTGISIDPKATAVLGENLVVNGLDETNVCIGDQYRIGEVVMEVSQPREPCWKLSHHSGFQKMTYFIVSTGLSGWYLRVIQEGELCSGEPVQQIQNPYPDLNILALNQAVQRPKENAAIIQKACECPLIGPAFLETLRKKSITR